MNYQAVFKRYELKYMITQEQKNKMIQAMAPYMVPDQYGRTTIRNLYFDTDNYRLVRKSIERPTYKEKLRVRSYAPAAPNSTVFVELKKKYKSVVFKRRISISEEQAMAWLTGQYPCSRQTQIRREIDYFLSYYGELHPVVFLCYDREAYCSPTGENLRVTFDDNLLCRQQALTLTQEAWGTPLLEDGRILMEIKCSGGIPLWLVRILSREHLYKTPFSKYGTAYQKIIYPQLEEAIKHA